MKTFRQLFSLIALVIVALATPACAGQPVKLVTPPPAAIGAPALTAEDRATIAAKFAEYATSEQLWSDYYATNDGERFYRAIRKSIWLAQAALLETSTLDRATLVAALRTAAESEQWWSDNYATNDAERAYRAWRKEIFLQGATFVENYRAPAASLP